MTTQLNDAYRLIIPETHRLLSRGEVVDIGDLSACVSQYGKDADWAFVQVDWIDCRYKGHQGGIFIIRQKTTNEE